MLRSVFLGCLFLCSSCLYTQTETQSMQSWNYPYELHEVVLDDSIRIAYVDENQSQAAQTPTLLFIHGLGSNLQAWKKTIDPLRNSARCIALDLPGYGKSSTGDYPFGMAFMAETVERFINELNLEQVVLVGHSMGGQVAIHVSLRKQVPVQQLVLVAPAGFETFNEQEKAWYAQIMTPALIKATPEEQIVKNFEINFYDMPDDARFMIEDRLQLRADPAYEAYSQMIPKNVMAMLNEPVFDQLSQIELPTLVLYGENDQLIPNRFLHPTLTVQQVAESGANQLANAQLHLIPRAGHFVQWERAEMVNQLLLDFID